MLRPPPGVAKNPAQDYARNLRKRLYACGPMMFVLGRSTHLVCFNSEAGYALWQDMQWLPVS